MAGKPEGVRVHHTDTDTWTEPELEFVGWDEEGMELWRIPASCPIRMGIDEIHCEKMPGMTGLGFHAPRPPMPMGWSP